MADTTGPNQLITITLERWRWEQILLCLDRYVSVLRGDEDALRNEGRAGEICGRTEDHREGLAATVEKRDPVFVGR